MRPGVFAPRQMIEPRVEIEIFRDGQFSIEREGLRHVADALPRRDIACIDRPAKSSASPLLGVSSPVSIFMVVVLPQPFDPTKPKISPRLMAKLTRSTAVKSPKRQVRSRARSPARRRDPPARRPALTALSRRDDRAAGRRKRARPSGFLSRLEVGGVAGRQHAAVVHRDQGIEAFTSSIQAVATIS